MSEVYFQFDNEDDTFLQAFEKAKKIQSKKLMNKVWDIRTITAQDVSRANDVQRLDYGIKLGVVIKPALTYGKKHSEPVDDSVALTRTYSLLDVAGLAEKESQRRENEKKRIDEQAATVRRFFVPDQLLEEEYRRVEILVTEWVAGGSVAENAPQVLKSEMDAKGITAAVASATIIGRAAALNGILDSVRDIRLKGKEAVAVASGIDIESTAKTYTDQLEAILPA